jgi:hypothetical protein
MRLVKDLPLPCTLIAQRERTRYDFDEPLTTLWRIETHQDKEQFVVFANPRLWWQVATPEQLREVRDRARAAFDYLR